MIGVVVPARDEEERIDRCLDALAEAAARVDVAVHVTVVLDGCRDRTADRCAGRPVRTVTTEVRGVGRARHHGIGSLTDDLVGRGHDLEDLWIATTDADSAVDPDWLAEQLALARGGADVVLGVVTLDRPTAAFRELYGDHAGAHPHVHGASMGFSLQAYRRAGGFGADVVGEDVDLAARFEADPHLRVVRTTRVRVRTSDRRTSRVRGGFADVLRALDAGEAPPTAVRA